VKKIKKIKTSVKENRWTIIHTFSLIFITLYLCVDFIPRFGKYVDLIYPQWLYLTILTLICLGFITCFKDSFKPVLSLLVKNGIVRLFVLFILISAISLINATNLPEGLIALGRIVLTFYIFFFLSLFIYQLKDRFHILAKLIIFILLYQSVSGLFDFFDKAGAFELKTLFSTIADDFANKNIMAITILIKIPFVLFVFQNSKRILWKIISSLTLIPAISLVFILNARAAYIGIGLIFLIYVTAQAVFFFKLDKKMSSLRNISIVFFVLLLTSVVADKILSKYSENSVYGTVFERIKTIDFKSSSGRIMYWKEGLNLFEDNFILGVGEGNFKIDFLEYRNLKLTDSLVYPRRLHNDFLETAIETGIFGGLCYLSMFFCLLIYFRRTQKRAENSFTKELAFLSLLAAAAYSVDAFFNFPMERSNIQVYFGMFMAVSVISYLGFDHRKDDHTEVGWLPVIWISTVIVLLAICYLNFISLKSSQFQYKYHKDKKTLKQKADDVAQQFPNFPTIDYTGQPIKTIKAIYYMKEKRFQEALDVLNKGKNPSPHFLMEDYLKVNIYTQMGRFDKAMDYALAGNKKAPRFYPFVNSMIQLALKKEDIKTALSVIRDYLDRNPAYPLAWVNYAELINIQTHDFNKVCEILNAGIRMNPRSEQLLEKKLSCLMAIVDMQRKLDALHEYISVDTLYNDPDRMKKLITYLRKLNFTEEGIVSFREKKLKETRFLRKERLKEAKIRYLRTALLKNDDYANIEKLSIIAFQEEDYTDSIKYSSKIISSHQVDNGGVEYLRGLSFLKLDQKMKACADFRASVKKKYAPAQKYLEECSAHNLGE
jgi:O-antigen ligase